MRFWLTLPACLGINDRPEDAAALLEATRDVECSFNLIMWVWG